MQELTQNNTCQKSWQSTAAPSVLTAVALFVLTAGLSLFSVSAHGLVEESGTEAAGGQGDPQVTGFRSARFGMSETETLAAIKQDFPLQHQNISSEMNEEDRTSSLVVTVEDIFFGSDTARIAYIHGFKNNKLIQVNVIWGSPVVPEVDPQSLVTAANLLRAYFVQLGFDPENTVINTRVDDRVFVVFRATDEQGRMALLQLISTEITTDGEQEKEGAEPQFQLDTLLLSYIEDFRDPDIFRIRQGDF